MALIWRCCWVVCGSSKGCAFKRTPLRAAFAAACASGLVFVGLGPRTQLHQHAIVPSEMLLNKGKGRGVIKAETRSYDRLMEKAF